MTNTNSTKAPTHRIYAVTNTEGEKAFWQKIGAAWANKDGKGFNLKFDAFPLGNAEIVIREIKPEEAEIAA